MRRGEGGVRDRTLFVQVALLFCAAFLVASVHLPYFPSWLAERGLSVEMIGVALAIPSLVRIGAAPMIASLADRTGRPADLLALCLAGTFLAFGLMYLAGNPWLILLLITLAAIAYSPVVALADAMASEATLRRPQLSYARTRLWGSVAFIGGNLAGGVAVASQGPEAAMWLIVGGGLLALLIVLPMRGVEEFRLPPRPVAAAQQAEAVKPAARRALLLTLLVVALINASHAVLYGFGTISWLGRGVPANWIGMLWSVGVVAEIVLFWLAGNRLSGVRPAITGLWVALAFCLLRWTFAVLDMPLPALFALQVMHAATFGITHLATIALIASFSWEGARAKAQGYAMGLSGLLMAVASAPSGWLFARFGDHAYLFMNALVVAAAFGLLGLMRILQHNPGVGEQPGDMARPS
jgi:PPP family 3-phenylpropionic acid transporter